MADAVKLKVQRTVFDLDAFEDVTLLKEIEHKPVESTQEALERLGNDAKKFLEILNEGLEAEARRKAGDEPSGWKLQTEDGEIGDEFKGTVADSKTVNTLVLSLAKTTFGYAKDSTKEQKTVAKTKAMDFIKATDVIKNGLKESAAKK